MTLLGSTAATGAAASAANEENAEALPGYYEFFMKAGRQTRLGAEAKRDEKIRTGALKAVHDNKPVLDLRLPDAFGRLHGTRDHVGRKHLVMITGRAWW
jgi:hypothetical protein